MKYLFKRKPKGGPRNLEGPHFTRSVEVCNGTATIAVREQSHILYGSRYTGSIDGAREMRDALTAAIENAERLEGACAAAIAGQR